MLAKINVMDYNIGIVFCPQFSDGTAILTSELSLMKMIILRVHS